MNQKKFYVDLTPELVRKAEDKIDFMAKEGCTKNGALENVDTSVRPIWYDEARFKRGQAVIKEHYVASANASAAGLLLFLQLPVGLVPLLSTGKSKNSTELFKRYFGAAEYMEEWFHQDPFDKNNRAYKTLSITKSLHLDAYKMMNKKISVFDFAKNVLKEKNPNIKDEDIEQYIRNKDRKWVSQYDMVSNDQSIKTIINIVELFNFESSFNAMVFNSIYFHRSSCNGLLLAALFLSQKHVDYTMVIRNLWKITCTCGRYFHIDWVLIQNIVY